MPSMLRNIFKYSLCLSLLCLFLSTSVLAVQPTTPELNKGKIINLGNQTPSNQHYYSKITLSPDDNYINNPICTEPLTGMLAVDNSGILHICNGGNWDTTSSPWDQLASQKRIFPKDYLTAQVVIGKNTIPSNPPTNRPDLVKLYLSEPSGSNQMEFKPFDENGNVGIEMYKGGIAAGPGLFNFSTYINFLVGDRGNDWDSRIEHYYNSPASAGLKFIGQRKNGKLKPANQYPELKLYNDGNVDFGSDEDLGLPARNASRKVKVYGDTKTDTLILDKDGSGGNPALPLKVKYDAAGSGGYYAVYAP